jgi:hypothetical protein
MQCVHFNYTALNMEVKHKESQKVTLFCHHTT